MAGLEEGHVKGRGRGGGWWERRGLPLLWWLFGSLQVVSQRYLWTEHEAPVTMDTAGQSGEGCHAVSTGWCNKTHSKHNELPLSPNHNEQTLLSGHAMAMPHCCMISK